MDVWVLSNWDIDDSTPFAVVETEEVAEAISGTPGYEHLNATKVPVRDAPPTARTLWTMDADGTWTTSEYFRYDDEDPPPVRFRRGYIDRKTNEPVPWTVTGPTKTLVRHEWVHRNVQARTDGIGDTDPWPDHRTHPQDSVYAHLRDLFIDAVDSLDVSRGGIQYALHTNPPGIPPETSITVTEEAGHIQVSPEVLEEKT